MRLIATIAATIPLAGCSTTTSTSEEPPADKPDQRLTQSAKDILADYKAMGSDRWQLVDAYPKDGRIVIETRLYPKPENEQRFVGICTFTASYEVGEGVDLANAAGEYFKSCP